MNFLKSSLFLSLIALSVQGAEYNLKDAVLTFVGDLEVQQELSNERAKMNHVNFLEHFDRDPETFNPEQCRYVEGHFPAFRHVAGIINTHMSWAFIEACGLRQDKTVLLRDKVTTPAALWNEREQEYMQTYRARFEGLSSEQFQSVKASAIREASREILRYVKPAQFVTTESGSFMIVRPQDVQEPN